MYARVCVCVCACVCVCFVSIEVKQKQTPSAESVSSIARTRARKCEVSSSSFSSWSSHLCWPVGSVVSYGFHLWGQNGPVANNKRLVNRNLVYSEKGILPSLKYYLPRSVRNFKRPKNREHSSDFDDFWTKRFAATRPILWKNERTLRRRHRRRGCRRRRLGRVVDFP